MKIVVNSPPLANDTAYGYELRYLDMARALREAGVTPEEMKSNARNLAWAVDIIRKEMQEQLREHCENVYLDDSIINKMKNEGRY